MPPSIVVVAGPNGAGKSTAAPFLLRDALGHSSRPPDAQPLNELARQRATFAFETTLASRSFAPWLTVRRSEGYDVYLVFLWPPDPQEAVRRVTERAARGGHSVPQDVVYRRYAAGLRNFFGLYQPLATDWRVYDTSVPGPPRLLALVRGRPVDGCRSFALAGARATMVAA